MGRSHSRRVVAAVESGRAALRGGAEILSDGVDSAAPIEIRDFASREAEGLQRVGRCAAITEETSAGLAGDALSMLPLNGIDVIGGRNVSHWGGAPSGYWVTGTLEHTRDTHAAQRGGRCKECRWHHDAELCDAVPLGTAGPALDTPAVSWRIRCVRMRNFTEGTLRSVWQLACAGFGCCFHFNITHDTVDDVRQGPPRTRRGRRRTFNQRKLAR